MSYKIPYQVTEIQLTYKGKIKAEDRPQICTARDAYWVLESNWSNQIALVEEFNVLLLDRSNRVMGLYYASKGGIAGTVVDLKVIFAAAIKARASSIIIAHNHPSGNLRPSQADIDLTNQFRDAGKILDIPLLDHLILSPDHRYYSFKDECRL